VASIANDPGGRRRVCFVHPNGAHRAIRLGKVSQRSADGFKLRVEQLIEAILLNRPMEADLAQWVTDLEQPLADKLARVGLIPKRVAEKVILLGEHLANYLARRTDVKQSTLTHWRQAERSLLAYFGSDRCLDSITAGDARDWERWLKTSKARTNRYAGRESTEGLAPNTVRKRVSDAKQFFEDAVSRELLIKNPFAGLKGAVGSNRERDYFVTRDQAQAVLDACPDAEWRLIFALARFGGLRCPSEILALTWDDINWATGRMLIRSSKTEHHEGKATRIVPIFRELRPYLEAVWDLAEPGSIHPVTRYRDTNANLRQELKRIIARAGLKVWPKLFQNLRASRATELASEHPAHVAAAWLGHSVLVANKHYWQVTDNDFAEAVGTDPKVAQKTAQRMHAESRCDSHVTKSENKKAPVVLGSAICGETQQNRGMGGTGLEPVTSTVWVENLTFPEDSCGFMPMGMNMGMNKRCRPRL